MSKKCQYCNNVFKTKSILNKHKKTAKYCLSMRNIKTSEEFKCEVCDKLFSLNDSYQKHCFTCHNYPGIIKLRKVIENKSNQIKLLETLNSKHTEKIDFLQQELLKKDKIIKELQDKLENIAIQAVKRPTTSNRTQINNYIQNMQPVTEECFIDNVQHLTIDHIKKGPEGYAQYALEYPLKDRVLCSDYSRRKVKFKDKDGNIITDPEMTTLARRFFASIKDKNKELICQCANELKEKWGDDNVMDTVVRLFDYKASIENGSDGEKSDFHYDFVKQVCNQTVKE